MRKKNFISIKIEFTISMRLVSSEIIQVFEILLKNLKIKVYVHKISEHTDLILLLNLVISDNFS